MILLLGGYFIVSALVQRLLPRSPVAVLVAAPLLLSYSVVVCIMVLLAHTWLGVAGDTIMDTELHITAETDRLIEPLSR